MRSSRAISLSLLAIRVGQSKVTGGMVQPKPAASSISKWMCEAITSSFFGTQPRITQVPRFRSDVLAALFHFGAKLFVDGLRKHLRPLVHIVHAELDGAGLDRKQLRTERGLVEGDEVLQLLLGEFTGVDLRHAFPDLLLPAGEVFRDNDRNLAEVLLVIEVVLHQ